MSDGIPDERKLTSGTVLYVQGWHGSLAYLRHSSKYDTHPAVFVPAPATELLFTEMSAQMIVYASAQEK